MGRLIDADVLIKTLKKTSVFNAITNSSGMNVFEIINEQPTVYKEKEIVDMLVRVSDCGGNEESTCPFFDECDCNNDACKKQWEEWLNN